MKSEPRKNDAGSDDFGELIGANGARPISGPIMDAHGHLFGTTLLVGTNDMGTVFEIAKTSTGYASGPVVLANFDGTNGTNPFASLLVDVNGDLFGTTANPGWDSLFEIAKSLQYLGCRGSVADDLHREQRGK